MRTYCESATRMPVLSVNLLAVSILPVVVFPTLPVFGESLDIKSVYTYREAVSAMEAYGEQGRRVYAWPSGTLITLLPLA